VLEARDVFFAAAALSSRKFLIGAGDRSAFLKMVLENDPMEIPDLYRKLWLVCSEKFMGMPVANDKLCQP